MIVTVQPGSLEGILLAPTSKSSMQRACAAALLRKGNTLIRNPGHSNDDKAALGVISALGASVIPQEDGSLLVSSEGVQPVSDTVNCGESGLGIRMFTPLVALSRQPITINGEGSLVTRPMDFFDTVLPQLGVKVQSSNGRLPLRIEGPLQPASIEVDGSLSSQFLTGLLMAYAAAGVPENVVLTVKELKSKPYIDLTLQVMSHFGWQVQHEDYERFSFPKLPAVSLASEVSHEPIVYTVEGDWSGAAFLLVAGAIAGDIMVKGLDVFSTQADKAILQALMSADAKLSIHKELIEVGPGPLKAFHFNATECPDLFPPLVALAAYCEGTTAIQGASRLTHKESNRALTLQEEFRKLGVRVELQDDLMLVYGGDGLVGADTHSHHDHRIAMACAVAGLKAKGNTRIEHAEAINKSYPDFYKHIQQLGAQLTIEP
ncbi:MAG: 3-phosphoshikimate 1-carboxyvinyltransferase [Candidatus Pseudobacter hemicellulosilyticus]|uniref:3-phosphoshikimate 1-carboxyvinyltransferase n=1 Tax=Candidatus Pseudobacter hemicellulosilyticus TaxID=3121375 RepID=A0AAJ5WRM5_9BACT|nr:MAG: 3-phosphoshikimate 1-carboxyvinyltransferase [Pseudobacter sp.]